MNNYMIGSDDIGADIFDDGDEDEMHEAVGAALAARASHVAQTRASPVAQTRASAPRMGNRPLSVQFEQTIQPHTKVWVSRRTGVELFRGQKVSTNTGKSSAVKRGGDLYVRALFVGGRSEIPLSIKNIDNFLNGKDATSMGTVEGNTPIRFEVENTSSEPKIFRAEISGIATGGNIDNTRAASSRVVGAEMYGPVSPQQLAEAKRPLTLEEQKAANEWKGAHPTFLQREAFGGLKYWQVGLGGAGLALILGGVVTLIVRKK